MSRRYGKGSGAARSAPFGTDVQPTTHLKIVGGRQVDVKDSPPTRYGGQRSLLNSGEPVAGVEVCERL